MDEKKLSDDEMSEWLMKSDMPDSVAERITELEGWLFSLLSVLHRDGGHHVNKYGAKESVKQAEEKYYKLISEKEELESALKEIHSDSKVRNGLPTSQLLIIQLQCEKACSELKGDKQ